MNKKRYCGKIKYKTNGGDILDLSLICEDFENISENIMLCHGDSLEKLKKIKSNSVDCVITDPPYFIEGMGNDWDLDNLDKKSSKGKVVQSLPVGMKFDVKQGIALQDFMEKVSIEVFRILKPGGFYLSFSQARLYHRMAIAIENSGFEIRDMLVWKREGQAKAFSQNHFVNKMKISDEEKEEIIRKLDNRKTPQLKPQNEPIVLAQKPKEGTFVENWLKYEIGLVDTSVSLDGKFPGTVIEVSKEKSKEVKHYTVKPVLLMEHLIKIFSPENAIICDPFLGSGSTAIACINTNRRFIGCELNATYYSLAKDRIINKLNND